jgi:hypothetical protein
MRYFRQLPNIQYESFLSDKQSSQDYILVKNIFRRCKIRDDLRNTLTIFNSYEIKDGQRPELVALEVYGSIEYDWVVITTSGITNIRDQWPLSNKDLYEYCERLYDDMNGVHHYETIEIKDDQGKLILPSGKIVNSNFIISYYDFFGALYTNNTSFKIHTAKAINNSNIASNEIYVLTNKSNIIVGDFYFDGNNKIKITQVNLQSIELESPITQSVIKDQTLTFDRHNVSTIANPVIPVTNYEYESKKNDDKRSIYILKPEYLSEVLKDMTRELFYDLSSQYIDDTTIRTENTYNTLP